MTGTGVGKHDSRVGRRGPIPVYPFLVGLYPVLAMYAHNCDQLTLDSLVLPVLVALGLAAASLFVMRRFCRGYRRAGIPAALFIGFFFAYGHVHMPLRVHRPILVILSGGLLMALMAVAVMAAAVLVRKKRQDQFMTATVVLNVVVAFLLAMPLVRIAAYEIQAPRQHDAGIGRSTAVSLPADDYRTRPNILYLVPDRYPSESTLVEIYGYDNSEFLDALRARGFFVADESRGNYGRTDMSLAATLNLEYLDSLVARTDERNLRRAFYWAIQDNRVVEFLRANEYRYFHFGTWWQGTSRGRLADANFNRLLLSEFVMMLYRTSLAYPIGAALGFDAHSEQWARVHYKLDQLETLDTVPGPVFVFAHFLVPHEPYVLDVDGGFISRFEQLRRGTIVGFSDQVTFINRRLLALADRLINAAGSRPWAIIIQADEGPHPPHNFEHTDSLQTLRAKFRILNAFYLPGADTGKLYSEISPVNTFRFLFDSYFGTEYGLLPDRSYLYHDLRFRDVTEFVRYGPEPDDRSVPPVSPVLH